MFIASDKAKILIDAGLPGKKIDSALAEIGENPGDIDGIFITHEHSDHIKGAGVLSRKYDIPIFANADTWSAMESNIGKIKEHNIKVIDRKINSEDVINKYKEDGFYNKKAKTITLPEILGEKCFVF